MTFIHGYLLVGLLLVGIPILVHLIMRQKPRLLRFPAFRFLRQRHLINRRKLQLQHLLLLLLRMAVIATLCLALARPRLAAERIASLFSNERPVAAVLVLDTSPSMEYSAAGRSRLDEARQRARELLDEMDGNSQVAVLDSSDAADGDQEWLSPALAQARLDGLRIRPANAALNRQIDRGARLLEKVGEGDDPPPRFLYVFSDRARACWDGRAATRPIPEGVRAVFVDVGAETPKDLAIEKVEVIPPVVAPGGKVQVHVTVRSTGADFDTELTCQIDNDPQVDRAPEKQPIRLGAGQGAVFIFERTAPVLPPASAEMTYQFTVRHQTPDALPFNNTHYASFLVRQRRKVLTIVDDTRAKEQPWRLWQLAIDVVENFKCDVQSVANTVKMGDKDLRGYAAVCVFQTAPTLELWEKLALYVRNGGGLVLVPGGDFRGDELKKYNTDGDGIGLLPGRLEKIEKVPRGGKIVPWAPFPKDHPIPAFFQKSIATGNPDYGKPQLWPAANAYWDVTSAAKDTVVVARFADKTKIIPALLDRSVGRGHVLLFTTPLDGRDLDRNRPWHNYWESESSFGLVLVDQVCRYLAGDSTMPELNYLCGQVPQVLLPAPLSAPPYTLDGPGLAVAETNLKAVEGEERISLPQAVAAGNYAVRDGKRRIVCGCSLNVRPQESELERVPAEEIEAVLGKDSVLQVGRTSSLKDALLGLRPPPLELLPWLMMAVLLVLAVESLLANRFYRRAIPPSPLPSPPQGERVG